MLIITDDSFGLVKYHISKNNEEGRLIKIKRSSCIKELSEILLTGVDYDNEGDLCAVTYLVKYEGKDVLPLDFQQDVNNKTYLVVDNVHKYKKHIADQSAIALSLNPIQYQHEVVGLAAVMEPDAWPYFWSEYCIGKFRSDPIKWYNEGRYLLFLYKERGNKKFSKEDLDLLYNKATDTVKDYLQVMFTEKGKEVILRMTPYELFVTFIGKNNKKALIQYNLEKMKPDALPLFMYMKEAFIARKIRLTEAVIIFDYLLNKETKTTTTRIRNLFNIT